METAHLICVFVAGFVVSRVISKSGLAQHLVRRIMSAYGSTFSSVLFILIFTTAFLSVIIPNALAVLAVLPVLNTLRQEVQPERRDKAGTAFALAVIFGANIGGMGALTGTPANALLIAMGEAQSVAGIGSISYANWFVWGIPLAAVLCTVGWGVLSVFFPNRRIRFARDHFDKATPTTTMNIAQKNATLFVLLATVTSVMVHVGSTRIVGGILAIVLTVGYCAWVLIKRVEGDRLLRIPDLYDGLPVKGLMFVGIVIVLGGILKLLDVDIWLTTVLAGVLPTGWSAFALCLCVALVTSFTTEVLSNTVVQVAVFLIVHAAAPTLPVSELTVWMIVTLSSTCAFMSPLATGVNALAFGGVRNVRLTTMLSAGFVMNVVCAVGIVLFGLFVMPY